MNQEQRIARLIGSVIDGIALAEQEDCSPGSYKAMARDEDGDLLGEFYGMATILYALALGRYEVPAQLDNVDVIVRTYSIHTIGPWERF